MFIKLQFFFPKLGGEISKISSTKESIDKNKNSFEINWKRQKKFHNFFDQLEHSYPHRLINFMYKLELSVLCLLRKFNSKEQIIFKRSKMGQFNDIIMHYQEKYICIKIEYIDTYYIKKSLNFNSLFSTKLGNFTLKNYLNEFAEELLNSESLLHSAKYLIIYTNSAFDLTNDKKLVQMDETLQLCSVNTEIHNDLLKLFSTNNESNCEFYQFANNTETRNKLLKMVKFTKSIETKIKTKLSLNEIKNLFWDKLIFAVNQSTIEELIDTVRCEIKGKNEDLSQLKKEIFQQLLSDNENKKGKIYQNLTSANYIFNLFIYCLHDMFLYKDINAIKFSEKIESLDIVINLRKNNYLNLRAIDGNICELSSIEFDKQREIFSLNSQFLYFIQELDEDLEYFIIYTNGNLEFLNELILGNKKFDTIYQQINVSDEKYFSLRNLYIDVKNLYQFKHGETRMKLAKFLNIFSHLTNKINETFSHLSKMELKELFFDKIIFAVEQFNSNEMYKVLNKEIEISRVPYNCEELCKIGFRYLMSRNYDLINKKLICELRNKIEINNICFDEEIKLAECILILRDAPEFCQFVDFLTKKGKIYLNNLRKNGIEISDFGNIIKGTKKKKVEKIFYDLYYLWFDKKGNKTKFLKNFEKMGFFVNNISTILNGSGSKGPNIFISLYDLWFDNNENPTIYLKSLKNEGINSGEITNLLKETGVNCLYEFKSLYTHWFDENGEKTQCLKILEKHGINLFIVYDILYESGPSDVNKILHFQHLFQLWFDKNGEKTFRLRKLKEREINLKQICRILKGSGKDAAVAFQKLYYLWFNHREEETFYLKKLENENVNLTIIFDILTKTGIHVSKVFINLYSHWFHENGEKTNYLKILESNEIKLSDICELLIGEGEMATKKFLNIFHSLDSPIKLEINDEILSIKQETFDENRNVKIEIESISSESLIDEKYENCEDEIANIKFEIDTDLESEEKVPTEKMQNDKNELDRKINFLFKLFKRKQKMKKILRVINNGEKLNRFLEKKLRKNKINQKEFQDLNSLINYGPFTKRKLNDQIKKFSCNKKKIKFIKFIFPNDDSLEFEELLNFLLHGDGKKYWKIMKKNKISWKCMGKIFKGSKNIIKGFSELIKIWFDENGTQRKCLKILKKENINLQIIIEILIGSGINAATIFEKLYQLWFNFKGNKTEQLQNLEENNINLKCIVNILVEKGEKAPEIFVNFYNFLFDERGRKWNYLKNLEKETKLDAVFEIMCENEMDFNCIKELYDLWYDSKGNKSYSLCILQEADVNVKCLLNLLKGTGSYASEIFIKLFLYLFDKNGNKTLNMLNIEKIVELRAMFEMISGAKKKVYKEFLKLYNVWFDANGKKTNRLLILEKNEITLMDIAEILSESGKKAVRRFKTLTDCVTEEKLKKYELFIELFEKKKKKK